MLRQHRETGDLRERPPGGGRPASLSPKHRRLLQQKVRRAQDISLAELQTYLQETAQVEAPVSTISRALKALDLPRQKKDSSLASATPTSAAGTGGASEECARADGAFWMKRALTWR